MVMIMHGNDYKHYYILGKYYYRDVLKHQKGTNEYFLLF